MRPRPGGSAGQYTVRRNRSDSRHVDPRLPTQVACTRRAGRGWGRGWGRRPIHRERPVPTFVLMDWRTRFPVGLALLAALMLAGGVSAATSMRLASTQAKARMKLASGLDPSAQKSAHGRRVTTPTQAGLHRPEHRRVPGKPRLSPEPCTLDPCREQAIHGKKDKDPGTKVHKAHSAKKAKHNTTKEKVHKNKSHKRDKRHGHDGHHGHASHQGHNR
jgi:hypothetical protein